MERRTILKGLGAGTLTALTGCTAPTTPETPTRGIGVNVNFQNQNGESQTTIDIKNNDNATAEVITHMENREYPGGTSPRLEVPGGGTTQTETHTTPERDLPDYVAFTVVVKWD